jgi:hypothetical protein
MAVKHDKKKRIGDDALPPNPKVMRVNICNDNFYWYWAYRVGSKLEYFIQLPTRQYRSSKAIKKAIERKYPNTRIIYI